MSNVPTTASVEIRVAELAQLFNTLDPTPFHQRDLDPAAEAHIVGWARDLPRDADLRLVLHLPTAEAAAHDQRVVESSLQNFFAYRAEGTDRDLRELFQIGRRALLIGFTVLVSCLLGVELLVALHADGTPAMLLRESLLILGWVANWRPLEIFLYDWWPIVRRRDLLRRLARARLDFAPERADSR